MNVALGAAIDAQAAGEIDVALNGGREPIRLSICFCGT